MRLSTGGGGGPKMPNSGGPDGSMITPKMGNGTKFKLSSVFPNVFNKIKGIRRNSSVHKLSSSASVASESAASDYDQKDFSMRSRDCSVSAIDRKDFLTLSTDAALGDRSLSPKRTFTKNRSGHARHTTSPILADLKAHDLNIPFPPESPGGAKNSINKPGPLSPSRILGSPEIVDPGCCSFDSSMALVPHDVRVRRAAPQVLGKFLMMSKCNSFNGSTRHSDSEMSETDSSTTLARIRHSRGKSTTQFEGSNPSDRGLTSRRSAEAADERASHGSGKVSIRRRFSDRRVDQSVNLEDRNHQLVYGASSPIHSSRSVYASSDAAAKYSIADFSRDSSSECRGSGRFLDSSREGTDLDRDHQTTNGSRGRNGSRPGRKLSFTNDHDRARVFDDASLSSDDDFYSVVSRNGNVGRGPHGPRSVSNSSQRHIYSGAKPDMDLDDKSGEAAAYTPEEANNGKAFVRRDTPLAKTVRKASDGWGQDQFSRFSRRDEKLQSTASHEGPGRIHQRDFEPASEREESVLVKTVLNNQARARENVRALVKTSEVDRHTLARLNADSFDVFLRREEDDAAKKTDYERFGLNSDSREFFSWKDSTHPSPIIEEVEKYTEGRVDYKRSVAHKECAQPAGAAADCGSDLHKGTRTGKSAKEFGKPWDTEFPSFRSDSIVMGAGNDSADRGTKILADERPALTDCTHCGSPAPLTPRFLERQRQSKIRGGQQQQQQDLSRNCGKVAIRAPSNAEDVIGSPCGMKSGKPASQVASPRLSSPRLSSPRLSSSELSGRPKRSTSSFQEFCSGNSTGKRMPTRTPSHGPDVKGARRSTSGQNPLSSQDLQQHQQQPKSKSNRTPSPARNQSPLKPAGGGKPLTAKAEAGIQRLDSVAVVKASYDPYQDFRQSMVEMIFENEIRTSANLEDLLQCYLSLNSAEYHKIIVEVFTDVWGDIFEH